MTADDQLPFDARAPIRPTKVTFGWVQAQLKGRCAPFDRLHQEGRRAVRNAVAEKISGAGFLSYVFRVRFAFADTAEGCTVILKVPTVNILASLGVSEDHAGQVAQTLGTMHNNEIYFYRHVAQHCKEIRFPAMFAAVENGAGEDGCILMEDVGDKGCLADVVEGLSLEKCEDVFRCLARFHAFTFTHLNSDIIMQMMKVHEEQAPEPPANLLSFDPYFEQHKEKFLIVKEVGAGLVKNAHFKFNLPPLLAHGDCWANNVFFERQPDGRCNDRVFTLFDWQLPQVGTGCGDLARFLATSARADVLRSQRDHLLRLYYDAFAAALSRRGRRAPYAFAELRRMFAYELPTQFMFAALVLPAACGGAEPKRRAAVVERLAVGLDLAYECVRVRREVDAQHAAA